MTKRGARAAETMGDFPTAEYDYLMKIIMVGDSGVGKSALLKAFMGEEFTKHYVSTIGVDFEIKQMTIHDKKVHLQIVSGTRPSVRLVRIPALGPPAPWPPARPPHSSTAHPRSHRCSRTQWDTAGQERFRTITTSYYRSSDAILLVLDVTDKNSFRNIDAWLEDVRAYARKGVDIMLVGNKVDLEAQRVIDFQEAKAFADENFLPYMETSAKTGFNVEKAFNLLALEALQAKMAEKDRVDEESGGAGGSGGVRGVALGADDSAAKKKQCC